MPHLSITVALGLVLAALGVLIYFIHHIAKTIQLPEVIASIAGDLSAAVDSRGRPPAMAPPTAERRARRSPSCGRGWHENGATVPAAKSGYLQFVAYADLVDIAAQSDAVIRLLYRPGHFVVEGLPLAEVWPPGAAAGVARRLERAHVTGPHRTLAQDLAFAIDQLVEIAIRALSPAVNDTFTAMTCIDWLADGLCKMSAGWSPRVVHRDGLGHVRVIAAEVRYDRFVERAFDKIRQAGRGMPAVLIRQLDGLARIAQNARQPTRTERPGRTGRHDPALKRGVDPRTSRPGCRASTL